MTDRLPLPLLLLVVAACGAKAVPAPAAPSPSATSAVPAPVAPPAPVAAAAAPFDFALPADAALTAALDLAKLGQADAQQSLAPLQFVVEGALGLTHAQTLHDLFASVGVDDRRAVTVALLPVDEEGRRAIATLGPLVPTVEPETKRVNGRPVTPTAPFFAPMREALAAIPALASARVLVPASDPARVRGAIDAFMKQNGWDVGAPGQYATKHAAATATVGEGVVALDFATGEKPLEGLAAIRAAATKHGEAPSAGDGAVRISYSPALLAEQSFLTGITKTVGAVSGESIAPDLRERIAAEGLWESARNFVITKNEHGERWTHVDVSLALKGGRPALTMRAEPGGGFDLPPEGAWTPSFSVTSGSTARLESPSFDVSRAFLAGWRLPGGAEGATLETKPFLDLLRSAGTGALLAALPDLAVVAPGLLNGHDELAPKADVLGRFARFGLTEGGSVFFGVLPEGTTRANAECVLAGSAPCGAQRVALGTAGKDGDARVTLVQLERHFVLLRTNDKDGLAAKLKSVATSPVRASMDLRRTPIPLISGLPLTAVETVRREGNALVAEITVH